MRLSIQIFIIIFIVVFYSSCSSIDSDAKKAADYTKESILYAKNGDLKKAEDAYKKSQEIISQYNETEDFDKFHVAYNNYILDKH
ncbi:MAG: hypothetical protein E6767_15330 [Dysgonomonas sp.]|nr:hypothetical protein [Dysgonomonas sp.]